MGTLSKRHSQLACLLALALMALMATVPATGLQTSLAQEATESETPASTASEKTPYQSEAPAVKTQSKTESSDVTDAEDSKAAEAASNKKEAEKTFQQKLDLFFGEKIVTPIYKVLFFDISRGKINKELKQDDGTIKHEPVKVPLIVLFLLLGGVFCTLRFKFVNLRLFKHCLEVIKGRYDDPNDKGEVSHFQALTSALSATVGLGNIAGVALAISGGGPGAVFWMWVVAFFGMSAKFASCSLAQMFRSVESEGDKDEEHILGGPMMYLERGMKASYGTIGFFIGKVLAIFFAFFTIMGALGGGNMFQANQTFEIVSFVMLDGEKSYGWLAGLIMAALVGLVMIGGIKRIGEITSKLVPTMCLFYCLVSVVILIANFGMLPELFASIFKEAFNFKAAGFGGFAAIMVTGITRGAFSNEAGLGSAAIAHSAAKTSEPIREGIVAMIGPFIDTILVCTMTALVILVAQEKIDPTQMAAINSISTGSDVKGAALTSAAFGTVSGFLPFLLCIAVFIFAYSTMISWGYYGERATEYLVGTWGIWPYRIVFLSCVVLGPMISLLNVKDFTDLMILSMAYPNIIGLILLSPLIAKAAKDYASRLKSGEIKTHAELLELQSLTQDEGTAPEHGGKDS